MAKPRQLNDVRFIHYRVPHDELNGEVQARGGATIAYVVRDGFVLAAAAFCNPMDNFNRKYGANKAEGRLMQLIGKTMNNGEVVPTAEPDDDKYFQHELAEHDNSIKQWINHISRNFILNLGYV